MNAVGICDEIWAGRPWGRRCRYFEGLAAIRGCGSYLPGCLRGGLGPLGRLGLARGLGPTGDPRPARSLSRYPYGGGSGFNGY